MTTELDTTSTEDDAAPDAAAPAVSSRTRFVAIVATVVAVLATVAAVVAGVQWQSAHSALAAERGADADRATAENTARAYTERSLTYDHTDIDGFFGGVEEGTTDALRERFDGVREVLTQIMTDSQVVASGRVNAATVTAQEGDTYTVSVFATQTTQNLQQPEPGAVPTLLTVTVERTGDEWLVSDYGADTGTS
ncbi:MULTISPECIES: hypothetical protein [Nocardiaceae]|uniref:Mce-associated membrane protein n=1 Tax=Rhodococcoides corynebacterioides TaxID=53972 RepID=A0ABS2KYA3_9NOCA|nr:MULTISPECIES: hypothetical protein [Rhodococcus]MBM7416281.1 Mce-associated membrane protein [Rhodococcus corynebacterioides]MBP1114534.1 Mce-associated membrane protein [Rhodococcus sp. PvP016]